jgi:hypothetical protein
MGRLCFAKFLEASVDREGNRDRSIIESSKLNTTCLMTDPYALLLFQGYTESEIAEIQAFMTEWDRASYTSIAHSVVDHAERHGFRPDYLKYLRKAHNFNRKRAKQRVLSDGSVRWNKGIEFLIERNGKIISYGEN